LTTYAIIAAVSYLLGSIPFGYILVRLFLEQDIRTTGSGNIGATNVGRTGHKGLALLTLLLDGAKGVAAVFVARMMQASALHYPQYKFLIGGTPEYFSFNEPLVLAAAVAALFAIVGHLFPVWLRFKGGKGVATGAGAFIALAPKAVLVVLAIFIVIVAIFRYVSLGSIIATAMFPVAVYFFTEYGHYPTAMTVIALCALLIIVRHHQNIGRLLKGTENKLGAKAKVAA
jgi:glycerol-3-phosphate acyltransferase PlsY